MSCSLRSARLGPWRSHQLDLDAVGLVAGLDPSTYPRREPPLLWDVLVGFNCASAYISSYTEAAKKEDAAGALAAIGEIKAAASGLLTAANPPIVYN